MAAADDDDELRRVIAGLDGGDTDPATLIDRLKHYQPATNDKWSEMRASV